MPAFHPRIRVAVVGIAAFALVAIGVGGTVAASNPATLYACFDAYGSVRISDINTCKLPGGGRLAPINAAGVPGPVGATGLTGPAGATGPTGATGARGPSHAYSASAQSVAVSSGPSVFPTVITAVTVPAGDYAVWATGEMGSVTGGGGVAQCWIDAVGAGVAATVLYVGATTPRMTYAMTGTAWTLTGGVIEMVCWPPETGLSLGPVMFANNLLVIPVGGIN